jgi:hypothetical protein
MKTANTGWIRWYSLTSYLRSPLWTVPLIAVVVYAVVEPLTEVLGRWMIREGMLDSKTGLLGLSMTGTRSFGGDIVSAGPAGTWKGWWPKHGALTPSSNSWRKSVISSRMQRYVSNKKVRSMTG